MTTRRDFFKLSAGAAAALSSSKIFALTGRLEPPRYEFSPQADTLARLNSNENAYGPFASVLAMSNPFEDANRYPFHSTERLEEKLALMNRINPKQVMLGCGSTEIIKLAVSAFTSPSRGLVMAAPTFEAAEIHANAIGAPVTHVSLAQNKDYSHDLEAMLVAARNAGLVYICNPNNPTASLTGRKDLEAFIAKLPPTTYVLMDEAYHDFVPADADYRSFLEYPVADDRVIVARTFSKIYGIAGLRLGYAVAPPAVIEKMRNQSQLDSVNIFATRCASVSLDDATAHKLAVERNAADRQEFLRNAANRKITAIPSSANFVMIETKRPVKQVITHFEGQNVLVGRPFPPYATSLRVSLGTPTEMAAFWRAWDQLPV